MAAHAENLIATVYVQNLEERVKIDTLVETLRVIFSEFGNVVDIVAKKNLRAKGQAFVVFDQPESARTAVKELEGFKLFDKSIRTALARTRSDKTVELQGNDSELQTHKRRRLAEKEQRKTLEATEEQKWNRGQGVTSKIARSSGPKTTTSTTSAVIPDEYLPPNKILFLRNAPENYDIEALSEIFSRFEGFSEIRLVPGRRGIAFVEYEGEQGAVAAKENTAGMVLEGRVLSVTYQRQ